MDQHLEDFRNTLIHNVRVHTTNLIAQLEAARGMAALTEISLRLDCIEKLTDSPPDGKLWVVTTKDGFVS